MKYLSLFLLALSTFFSLKAQVRDFKNINFDRADSIAAYYAGEKLDRLPLLTYQLTASLDSEVEKFRAIYTWVSQNIQNDYAAYLKNKRKRAQLQSKPQALAEWNQQITRDILQKLKKQKKTVCTGYAYLIKELANLADIPCEIVDGYGRTVVANIDSPGVPNHSWNAVKLGKKWYLCDATWSSGYFQLPDNVFIADYREGYFLADPALFIKSHYPLEARWFLMDSPPSLEEFLHGPIIYAAAFDTPIIPLSPTKRLNHLRKNEYLELRFKTSPDFPQEQLTCTLQQGYKSKRITPAIQLSPEGELKITYKFPYTGDYDLLIQREGKPLFTYSVKVRRK